MFKEYRNRPREEAVEFIEAYIIGNKLAAHNKLPSERNFCYTSGFNRSTLRNAINKLESDGLVYSRHGAGTFVAPPKLLRDLQNMESLSFSAARTQKELRTTQLYGRVLPCVKEIAQKLAILPVSPVFVLRRLRTLDNVPFMLETSYIDYTQCRGIEQYDFNRESLYKILEQKYGITADHGVEYLSITYAGFEESTLLNISVNQAVFFIEGISDTVQGRHIEYFESVTRSDMVQFTSNLRRVP
jgi:GntR family transcriptional regulator